MKDLTKPSYINNLNIFVIFFCFSVALCFDKDLNLNEHSLKAITNLKIHHRKQDLVAKISDSEEQMSAEPSVYQGNCYVKMHKKIYNLYPMSLKNSSYTLNTKDGRKIDINICEDVSTDCTNSIGLIVDKSKCIKFADSWKIDKTWEIQSKNIINKN
jgi:hypothetical protein